MKAPITLMQGGEELARKRRNVEDILRDLGSVLVAFSGGADSALLLRLAHDTLAERAHGVIAVSESIPDEEVEAAMAVAREMDVTLHVVHTKEFENERYRANNGDRCYHCKVALFNELEPLAERLGIEQILYGANHDDLGDYRPGQQAARQRGVRAPLLEASFSKLEVRELSRELRLPTWNKPAMACLSSRIPHGSRIESEALRRIAEAERFLRGLGVSQVRVRTYDKTARIETDVESIGLLIQPGIREQVISHLQEIGYEFITVDLEGFRSGSLNPKRR